MDKKTLLAVGLSIIVLLVFQVFFAPQHTVITEDNNTQVTTPVSIEKNTPKKELAIAQKTIPKRELKKIILQNNNINLVLDENTGNIVEAKITSFNGKTLKNIEFSSSEMDYFSMNTGTNNVFKIENISNNGKKIVLTSSGETYTVTKTYELSNEGYIVNLTTDFINNGDSTLSIPVTAQIGPGLGSIVENTQYMFTGPLMYNGKKIYDEKQDKVDEVITEDKPIWLGYTSKYYLFAIAGDHFEKGSFKPAGTESAIIQGKETFLLNPGSKETRNYHLFIGPKQYDLTKESGYGFEKSIEFGIFSFLAIPMLKILIFLNSYIGNYGVAIILLTIIIKLVTYPLTAKSMISMKKMQSYQPKIKEIKEKYKSDQQKANAATMELYKKEGINPVGGCLPMLLQIPIFFALYKALMVAIELNGAPFFGWIVDMSLKDPYYITPVLMGITMFLQQKLSPSAGDPMQQKIFLMMPIIFTFLFLNFPAGLVIYWLTNNCLTIAQQMFINKRLT